MTSAKLRSHLSYWLVEGQYAWMDWGNSWLEKKLPSRIVDFITERIQRPLIQEPGTWLLCNWWGHLPVADQCGIPDHDYCARCNASTPGQADIRPRWNGPSNP